MNLVFCGLPGSGKTTIGKEVAKRLNWTFFDSDELIEKAYFESKQDRLSCRDIYLKEGAEFFRHLEKEQLMDLKNHPQQILSLGGGSLEEPLLREKISNYGSLVYLKVPLKIIWERFSIRGIPVSFSSKKQFEEICERRKATFERLADIVIEPYHYNLEELLIIFTKLRL